MRVIGRERDVRIVGRWTDRLKHFARPIDPGELIVLERRVQTGTSEHRSPRRKKQRRPAVGLTADLTGDWNRVAGQLESRDGSNG